MPITAGKKGTVILPNNFQITEWTINANTPASVTVDVLSGSYSTYPTTNSIVQGSQITLNSAIINRASVNWGMLNSGDIIEFNVTSPTNATLLTVALKGKKS